ncbi:MAG TPA: hypothetical protein VER58_16655 [Thermoanaerobaculia bacterium]|nr:hypothetical protein [Thermoanaerobaculia bacterium]
MFFVSFALAGVLFAAPAVATPKTPAPLTDAELRELAGVIATIEMVESRLYREMALAQPTYKEHVVQALKLMKASPLVMQEPSCPPGTCEEDSMCVACVSILCNLITLNGRIRSFKTNLMKNLPNAEPAFRSNEKGALALAQNLVRVVGGTKALSQSGYCPHNDILFPCK